MAMIVGITGGIASGKSSVSRLLAAYCPAPLIDLDQCCRHLLYRGESGWQALHDSFGTGYELPDGTVDRPKLRQRLFADAAFRQRVEGLLHPLVLARMQAEIDAAGRGKELILVEIPLLYEAGWQSHVDAVLVVYVRRAVQCCRLMRRDGISRKEARLALAAQMELAEKAGRADYIIDNSDTWHVTRRAVVQLGDQFGSKAAPPAATETEESA